MDNLAEIKNKVQQKANQSKSEILSRCFEHIMHEQDCNNRKARAFLFYLIGESSFDGVASNKELHDKLSSYLSKDNLWDYIPEIESIAEDMNKMNSVCP